MKAKTFFCANFTFTVQVRLGTALTFKTVYNFHEKKYKLDLEEALYV